MNQVKLVDTAIIHKAIEPGVINEVMLNQCIAEQGFKGEAGRLAAEESIRYDKITSLRLEQLNILKIDHLWLFPNLTKLSLNFNKLDKIENLDVIVNLKELDLSFNYIDKIENLEKLTKLEVLTLYSNIITKVENLDSLTNLIILSIGMNKINTLVGIERFRFFKNLRSLNLEDNPIAQDSVNPLRIYLAALLPQLKYYNYICINQKERDQGLEIYKRELRELQELEKDEIALREKIAKEKDDEIQLSESFVEFLNEHQLFESFFVNDENTRALLLIGDETKELVESYRSESYQMTQKVFELGLERHKNRMHELKLFENCVDDAKLIAQKNGQEVVENFLEKKIEIFEITRKLMLLMPAGNLEDAPDEFVQKQQDLNVQFIDLLDTTWKTLMEIELNLFERVEEANTAFGHTISDMMNTFVEAAQGCFVQLRDATMTFCDGMQEMVTRYIANKMILKQESTIPPELIECVNDKEIIGNLVAGMREHHMLMIDMREDRLIKRANGWVKQLKEGFTSNEIKRNRNKVMEINYFLDQQREEYEKTYNEKDEQE